MCSCTHEQRVCSSQVWPDQCWGPHLICEWDKSGWNAPESSNRSDKSKYVCVYVICVVEPHLYYVKCNVMAYAIMHMVKNIFFHDYCSY